MTTPRHEYKRPSFISRPANDLSVEPQDESEWPEAIRVAVRELRRVNVCALRVWFDESKLAWIIEDAMSRLGVAIDGAAALNNFDAEQLGSRGADCFLDAMRGQK